VINTWNLDPDLLFDPEPPQRSGARKRYDWVADLLFTGLVGEEDAPETAHRLVDAFAREPYLPEVQAVRSAR
jgi:hypothetical protein